MARTKIYAAIVTIIATTSAQAENANDKSALNYFDKAKDFFAKFGSNNGKDVKDLTEDGINFYKNGVKYGVVVTSKSPLTAQQTQNAGTSGMDAVGDATKIIVRLGGRAVSTAGAAAMLIPLHDGREVMPVSVAQDNAIGRMLDVTRNGGDVTVLEREHVERIQNSRRVEANYKGSIVDTITSQDNFFSFLSRITGYETDTKPKLDNEIKQTLHRLSSSKAETIQATVSSAKSTSSDETARPVISKHDGGDFWKYTEGNVTEACEPINFAGENWVDSLIKEDLGPECKLTAKDVTPTRATYSVQCVYEHAGCSQCVDITTANVRSGGIAASTEILDSRVNLEKDGEDRILITRKDSRGDGGTGVFERCQP